MQVGKELGKVRGFFMIGYELMNLILLWGPLA